MQLESNKRGDMITFLEGVTSYPLPYLKRLYDNQLYAMYQKIFKSHSTLQQEIVVLQNRNPFGEKYSLEELKRKKIAELLKIKNHYRKKETPTQEESFPEEDLKEEILTISEVEQMYGSEYTKKDLGERGIYLDSLDTPNANEMSENEELKEEIISFLLEAHQKGILYIPFTKEKLEQYSLDALKKLYRNILNEDVPLPTLEELIMRLYISQNH